MMKLEDAKLLLVIAAVIGVFFGAWQGSILAGAWMLTVVVFIVILSSCLEA